MDFFAVIFFVDHMTQQCVAFVCLPQKEQIHTSNSSLLYLHSNDVNS